MSSAAITPGAEPFSADRGDVAVLLSHGFTGSPASMRPWAKDLARRGYTVRVPLLPGHGTTWQDLNSRTWDEWYSTLEQAYLELAAKHEKVVVAGLSMGGALGLRLAQHHDVAALVLVNPAIAVKDIRLKLLPVLKHLVPALPGIGNDIKRPGADEIGYDKTPLKALHSQTKMWADVVANLGKVTAPLLVLRSEDDHVVDPTSLALIKAHVGSSVTQYVTLSDSFHVATLDHDDALIFETTGTFLAEHVGTT